MDRLLEFLASFDPEHPTFPPTQLYNEGWLLRLVLDWLARNPVPGFPLDLAPGATWFSEALLPSPFRPRYRGDPLSESRTHADGVVGHIAVGQEGKADLALAADAPPGAAQLLVLEAKLSSGLSVGTKNVPDYDQAARNVACMAEVLQRAEVAPDKFASLGFYVLAPRARIEAGVFASQLTRESVLRKVVRSGLWDAGVHDGRVQDEGVKAEVAAETASAPAAAGQARAGA